MKVVVNRCWGGFCLSRAAYAELGLPWDNYGFAMADDRANPKLVAVVEKLGMDASGDFAELKVVEIPDDIEWEINGYDGMERVVEKHRSW